MLSTKTASGGLYLRDLREKAIRQNQFVGKDSGDDLIVLRNTDPKDGIVRFVPLLCMEITSKDDRLNEMRQRVADYASIGVKDVWVIDPWQRVAYEETAEGLKEPDDAILRVIGSSIEISLAEVFRQLDEFSSLGAMPFAKPATSAPENRRVPKMPPLVELLSAVGTSESRPDCSNCHG